MKIAEILSERRNQQKTITAYHSTSVSNLESILKFGLQPDKDSIYDGDLKSHGGVYVSTSEAYALQLATQQLMKNKGSPSYEVLLVIIQLVTGSASIDEDQLMEFMLSGFGNGLGNFNDADVKKLNTSDNYDWFTIPTTKRIVNNISEDYASVNKMTSQFIKEYIENSIKLWKESRISSLLQRNPATDSDFLKIMNSIKPKGETVAYDSDEYDHQDSSLDNQPANFRITQSVKFKGKTRIVQIKKIDMSVYTIGDDEDDDSYTLVYPTRKLK